MGRRGLLALVAACAAGCADPGGAPVLTATCGDGAVQGREECDDANLNDADACLRTCELPARFVPSDPHIHGHGCGGALDPEGLNELSSGRGMEVTTPLVWGSGYDDDRRYFTGRDSPFSRPGALLHYELEVSHFPAAQTGHLLLYGLRSIAFSPDPFRGPHSGMPVVDFARAQGPQVVVAMAHGEFWPTSGRFPDFPETCCMPYDYIPETLRGRVTLLGTEHRGTIPALDTATALLQRVVLNSGGRVALIGASDFPCINEIDTPATLRTDVLLDDAAGVSYDRWLAALQRGRTTIAVVPGTRLNLRVNGARSGDQVDVRAGDSVRLTLEARVPGIADAQVLVNGVPGVGVHLEAGAQAAAFKLALDRSAWLQAVTPWAATSPIYVVVDGLPIRGSPQDVCYALRYTRRLMKAVQDRELDLGSSTTAALAAYASVRDELGRRFGEAGGTLCP